MSICGSIVSKIFGHREAAAAKADDASSAQATPPSGQPRTSGAADEGAAQAAATAAAPQSVDVAAVLTDLASKNPQKLDWRHSIVDLMKLLGLDRGRGAQATRPGAWRGRQRGRLRGDERVA